MAIALSMLVGCVAVWGSAYQIESADADVVTIKYDGHFTTLGNIDSVAAGACRKFAKSATRQDETTSIWGVTTVAYTCR